MIFNPELVAKMQIGLPKFSDKDLKKLFLKFKENTANPEYKNGNEKTIDLSKYPELNTDEILYSLGNEMDDVEPLLLSEMADRFMKKS